MSLIEQMRIAPYIGGLEPSLYTTYGVIGVEERIKKIARVRNRLNLSIAICPCDAKAADRGCIGCRCKKELIENGKCLCGCYIRTHITMREVMVVLKHKGLSFDEFLDYISAGFWTKYELPDGTFTYSEDAVIHFLHYKLDIGKRCFTPREVFLEGEDTLILLAKKLMDNEGTISPL